MARAVYSPFGLVFKRLGVQCPLAPAFSRFWRGIRLTRGNSPAIGGETNAETRHLTEAAQVSAEASQPFAKGAAPINSHQGADSWRGALTIAVLRAELHRLQG